MKDRRLVPYFALSTNEESLNDRNARLEPAIAMEITPTIFIVDDDAAVRSALSLLVTSCGWRARPYASAEEFLQSYDRDEWGCLLLDLQMPGMSGVDLQDILTDLGMRLPVIVVTAYKDHPLAERAKAGGALAVIAKPFRDEELVQKIQTALENHD